MSGFRRKLTPGNIVYNIEAVKKAFSASAESKRLLKQINPDIVVGTGGYVSGPVLKQAQKLGIKTAIHESLVAEKPEDAAAQNAAAAAAAAQGGMY